ncbi:MAG: hypothetical protein ACI841_003211 [Planctomycetota bacterium]|jgi:uncharacterized protein YjbK
MTDRREVEFKLQLRGESDVRSLLDSLGVSHCESVLQINHFFDTEDGALASGHWAMRLREEGPRTVLTAKGPARASKDAAVSDRPEEECDVDLATRAGILEGRQDPLAALMQSVSEASELLSLMRAAKGAQVLSEVGSFENQRRKVGPIAIAPGGDSIELVLELDRTQYPGDRVYYELEVEVERAHAERVGGQLRALFTELGLEWLHAPNKAQRFRAALQGRDI